MSEAGGATTPLEVESDGPDETATLAAAISRISRAGDLILLVGDLGAGKTTFAQGFGRALGIAEPVTSPTFTLVRQYPVDDLDAPATARGIRTLVHVDVYRLDTLNEIAELGVAELVEDGGVALVEWGEVAVGVMGTEWLSVRFTILDDEHRRINLVGTGSTWQTRWPELAAAVGARGAATPRGVTGGTLEEATGQ